ncbi:MAG: type IVB secretion system lipoprotein DotD [Legionellaceae bacterium]|nr:type IVB secretion system lipoprotein DotD [Legionellaceae bacterium]
MKNRILLMITLSTLLAACSSITYKKPPYNAPSNDATIKLAEAATSVSNSMLEMARVEKVVTPARVDNIETIPSTRGLLEHASVDWSGPIGELAERLAKAADLHLHVLGHPPAIPVLVSLNQADRSIAELLRDIDYQAGNKASIHVHPNSQVIELRYAKTYS